MNINNLTNEILMKTKLFWQYPVITEETFFNQNKHNNFYFGFPWATCIDKKINTNELLRLLINIKQNNINYYTCCQHISFRNYISLFKILGITILYTPHKIKGEDYINGIKIMPCPLYAVNIEDKNRNQEFQNIDLLNENRNVLYSFIGGVQTNYLTNIRNNIFNMKHPENSVIINTGDWHFNTTVYSQKQNINKDLNINSNHINNKILYNKTLLDSKFSLCPSGSGPNSIRFWESLGCGSIPVLLADTLDLPYNINWREAIIIVNEDDYLNIPNILKNISEEEIYNRREKCIEIYNNLKNNFKNSFKNEINNNFKTLFTSYLCNINDNIVQDIILEWKLLNPDFNILYFSDIDVNNFFKDTIYYDTYSKMKNGVAIADFFRLSYINKFGGFWFDIDLNPFKINISLDNNIHLFDCGFGNISYMFIGGKPNQKLFIDVLSNVNNNILNNIPNKSQHVMDITGPKIIQKLIFDKLKIINKDGCFNGTNEVKKYLCGDDYEFSYVKIDLLTHKMNKYKELQKKYSKQNYKYYNYI